LALYWHIGETTMRFGRVRSASLIGENKALGIGRSHVVGGEKLKRELRTFQWQGLWISGWRH
jgi:hypothetical protein